MQIAKLAVLPLIKIKVKTPNIINYNMNTKWTLISSLCAFQVLYFISNAKKASQDNKITPSIVASTALSKDSLISDSLVLSSLNSQLNLNLTFRQKNIESNSFNFSKYFNENTSHSKFFIFSSLNSSLRLVEISHRNQMIVYEINQKNKKVYINKCWSSYQAQDKHIIGAVTSNDKVHIALLYQSNENKNHFSIEYYNEDVSICSTSKSYDTIDINSNFPITSLTIQKDIIAYSIPNSNNKYVIMKKENDEWYTYKEERVNSEKFYSTSLKFINEEFLLQTSIEVRDNKLYEYFVSHNIFTNSTNILIEDQESHYELLNAKEIRQQKIYSNSMEGDEILFEFTKGYIYHANINNQIYLLDESSKKAERLSTDNGNIIIKYKEENYLYYIKKVDTKGESDYYTEKKQIVLEEKDSIVSIIVNKDELVILYNNGNISIYTLTNWLDNTYTILAIQFGLMSVILFLCWYLIIGSKNETNI